MNASRDERLLDLLGEQALAADVGERAVLHPVAGGLDHRHLDCTGLGQRLVGGDQPVAHQMGLDEREPRAASADAKQSSSGHGPTLRAPRRRGKGLPWHAGARAVIQGHGDGPCSSAIPRRFADRANWPAEVGVR
jgi:hypothetical protein